MIVKKESRIIGYNLNHLGMRALIPEGVFEGKNSKRKAENELRRTHNERIQDTKIRFYDKKNSHI